MRHLISAAFLFMTLGLIACGSDNGLLPPNDEPLPKQKTLNKVGSVDSYYDLMECTPETAGALVYVQCEDTYYVCSDKWYREHREQTEFVQE